jgi:putative DNA primase/helicase
MAKLPKGLLQANRRGTLANGYNALAVFSYDPDLDGCVRYNAFSGLEIMHDAPPMNGMAPQPGPYPRVRTDHDITLIRAYINHHHIPTLGHSDVVRAVEASARHHAFHPVLDWFKTLQWDGKPRLDNWLFNAFDAPAKTNAERDYICAVGSKTLIAAVRRILQPGCKFDTMLVLEGLQGIGKSTCCRALFGEWFTDDMPHNWTDKDAALQLAGVWGIELSEIAQLTSNRGGIETIKAFLSRQVDRYRPPYGRTIIERPRQMVFIGTTNHRDWAYGDETGNRRFWPVVCRAADHHWIALNREQIWAEAAVRESRGERIHLDTDELSQTAHTETEKRRDDDALSTKMRFYLVGKSEATTMDCMEAIGFLGRDVTVPNQKRCARILRALGWEQIFQWDANTKKTTRVWHEAKP